MIAEGALTEAEAEAHPNAHVITAWLGADADEVHPHVHPFVPDGPGTVLVCSDGLWNYLPKPEELAAVLADAGCDPSTAPLDAARTLVRHALDAGGRDNITVAVVPVRQAEPDSAFLAGEERAEGSQAAMNADALPATPPVTPSTEHAR
jgi:serine/threonine protein phosphatase PrpC